MKPLGLNTVVEIDIGIADTFIDHFITNWRSSRSKEKAAGVRTGIYDRCDGRIIQSSGSVCAIIKATCDNNCEALGLEAMRRGTDAVGRPVVIVVALCGNASGPDRRITAYMNLLGLRHQTVAREWICVFPADETANTTNSCICDNQTCAVAGIPNQFLEESCDQLSMVDQDLTRI